MKITPASIKRLRDLPQRPDDVWHGVQIELPLQLPDEKGNLVNPTVCMWLSERSGKIHGSVPALDRSNAGRLFIDTLVHFACDANLAGFRPGRIEVDGDKTQAILSQQLDGLGINVVSADQTKLIDELTKRLSQSIESMEKNGPDLPGLLDAGDISVEALRSFAEAAKEFFLAQPWQLFDGEERLFKVISPKVDKEFRHFTIIGGAGQEFGLAFFSTYRDYQKLVGADDPEEVMLSRTRWSIMFNAPDSVAPRDVEAWQTHSLPLAAPDRYPVALGYAHDGFDLPTASQLADIEGLLRVATSIAKGAPEQQIGRWRLPVRIATSERKFTVELQADPLAGDDMLETMREIFGMMGMLPPDRPTRSPSRRSQRTVGKKKSTR